MEKLTALQKVTLCTVTVATHTHTIIFLLAIKQWGIISYASKDTTTYLTFPIAFGTAYAAVFGSNNHGSGNDWCFEWASDISRTGISYLSSGANRTNIYWVAVGKA